MCGLNGVLSFHPDTFAVTSEMIVLMRDTMVHRGPDGAGVWVSNDKRIGLGHRRLSIIDLTEQAAQPMSNADQTHWLSFNGEIYNHAALRKELTALGHLQWKTDHSDTEVILKAYAEWGIDCVHRFRGMFAFALWDASQNSLWLVRDRVGIKPLYYSVHHGRITFASEIKALLQDPDQPRAVDEEMLFHYLSFLTTPAPNTLFDGINKLPPGTWARVKADGHITTQKYWDVYDHTEPLTNASEEEISERILEELRTAVQLRKVSDVPVGVFLSGGIDSSTNTALFSEGESSPVQTFSIGYQGEYQSYQNELHFAREMAEHAGAVYHEKLLTQDDLLDFMPRMIHLQDEPIGDPVCVPVYYVSELAKKNGVTVCQVGEGADELFWGYIPWKTYLKLAEADAWPIPRAFKKLGLGGLKLLGRDHTLYYEWLRRGAEGIPIFWGGVDVFQDALKKQMLSPRLQKRFKGFTSWEALRPLHQQFKEKTWEDTPLNWMSYVDLNFRLPELLLMRVDKMSMGVSLEARVPFLDHKFVELAMSIPQAVKTRNGTLKHILKKSVRGVIPDNLIDRKKQGFGVPIAEWLLSRLGDVARKELETFCGETDFLDTKKVLELYDKQHSVLIWYLLNLALWWKRNIRQDLN